MRSMSNVNTEIEKNYRAFQKKLPAVIETHRGKFALMNNAEIIDFFDTARDAYIAGQRLFTGEQVFSVQEVIDNPVDLGYFSHALPQ